MRIAIAILSLCLGAAQAAETHLLNDPEPRAADGGLGMLVEIPAGSSE